MSEQSTSDLLSKLKISLPAKLNLVLAYVKLKPFLKASAIPFSKFVAKMEKSDAADPLTVLARTAERYSWNNEEMLEMAAQYIDQVDGDGSLDIGSFFETLLGTNGTDTKAVQTEAPDSLLEPAATPPFDVDGEQEDEEEEEPEAEHEEILQLAVGDAVVYNPTTGKTYEGTLLAIDGDKCKIDTPQGEFTNVGLQYISAAVNDDGNTTQPDEGLLKVVAIDGDTYKRAVAALKKTKAEPGIPINEILLELADAEYDGGLCLAANVVNGNEGPWIDAYLENDAQEVVADMAAKSLAGVLTIEYGDKIYGLQIVKQ